jgi:hypothetical protein
MVFKIQTRNGEKNLSFNQTTMNNLIDEFSDETSSWVGKKVKVWMIKAMVSGKLQNVVYLSGLGWTMADDGTFMAPRGSKTGLGHNEKSEDRVNAELAGENPEYDDIPVF